MSRKTLLTLFSLIFVSGLLIRIFISPIIWPSISEVADPLHIVLSSIFAFLGLSLVYYLKVYGTPKTIRLFYTLAIGLALGFAIFGATATISKFFIGYVFKGFYFYFVFILSYIVAFIIGNYLSKRLHI